MSIAKMSLVNIIGGLENLDEVMMKISKRDDFHPEQPSFLTNKKGGFEPLNSANPYTTLLSKATDLGMTAGFDLTRKSTAKKLDTLEEVDAFLSKTTETIMVLKEQERELTSSITQYQNALLQLDHIESLNVSFDDIFSSEFLKVRFGRLSIDGYSKLKYYEDSMFFFFTFDKDADYHWGAYFTTEEFAPEIDDIFSSLYFERMRVPDYVHGTPALAKKGVKDQIEAETKQLASLKEQLTQTIHTAQNEFYNLYSLLKFMQESFELRKYVYCLHENFYILGFIPQENEQSFINDLQSIKGVKVTVRPPDSDKRIKPPTKLKNSWFARPFEQFVLMYGTPSYNDMDPTPYVAITYTLLFGLMFGDVGQGLLISLIGFLAYRLKKMEIGQIFVRIGFSSAFFGLIYGSVFGFEEVLNPLHMALFGKEKLIHVMAPASTNLILLTAVGIGAVIIILSILINTIMGFRQKDYGRAIFSQNGIAGLVFYLYVLAAAIGALALDIDLINPVMLILFVGVPLCVMFLKEPLTAMTKGAKKLTFHGGFGAYFTEGFFELFEILLSFVTNTMSFLRVGGFILSHAGMMLVVHTLSSMVGSGANVVVVIIGNLFVIALEGLIVGIQVLRLEFYEVFSRFYEGDGKTFVPASATLREQLQNS